MWQFIVVALSEQVRDRLRDYGLAAGAVIVTAAVMKLAWHPRSWFRRVPSWIGRTLVVEPLSRRAIIVAERFVERVITPKIDSVHVELASLSERNDDQHRAVEKRLAGVEEKLSEQNTKLIELAGHILTVPGLPINTGETPVTQGAIQ